MSYCCAERFRNSEFLLNNLNSGIRRAASLRTYIRGGLRAEVLPICLSARGGILDNYSMCFYGGVPPFFSESQGLTLIYLDPALHTYI
jgi:hypothetical protein